MKFGAVSGCGEQSRNGAWIGAEELKDEGDGALISEVGVRGNL